MHLKPRRDGSNQQSSFGHDQPAAWRRVTSLSVATVLSPLEAQRDVVVGFQDAEPGYERCGGLVVPLIWS